MKFAPLLPPSPLHPLGTTPLGVDALCYALRGLWTSVEVGLVSALVSFVILFAVGFLSLFPRSTLIEWILESLVAFPRFSLLVFIALVTLLKPSIVGLVVGFFSSLSFSKSIITKVRNLQGSDFCVASKAIGASEPWLFLKHCLPHLRSLLSRYAAISSAVAIYAEAGMAMLGLEDPSIPSVGKLFSLVENTPGAILTPAGQVQVIASVLLTMFLATLIYVLLKND